MNQALPYLLLSVTKYISPSTLLLDPSENPAFFTYFFLSCNSDWWMSSIIFCSIVTPLVGGLHTQKDKESIKFVDTVNKLTHRIPIVDLMIKIVFWIVPSLIDASKNNNLNLLVISPFLYTLYWCLQYILYIPLWMRSAQMALLITKSNHESLQRFKRRIKLAIRLGILSFTFAVLPYTYWKVVKAPPGEIVYIVIYDRQGFNLFVIWFIELLYLTSVKRIYYSLFGKKEDVEHLSTNSSSTSRKGSRAISMSSVSSTRGPPKSSQSSSLGSLRKMRWKRSVENENRTQSYFHTTPPLTSFAIRFAHRRVPTQ